MSPETQGTATLGGGCFWCIEAALDRLQGVTSVVPGYAGGESEDPTYEEVCSGKTGHAEVVQVTFDPDTISYRELLTVFLSIHDPTTPDRQGPDVGTQYRSIILTHDETQAETARTLVEELQETIFEEPIVTEIEPLETFHEAEAYHHDYFEKNPQQPYCRLVVEPKVRKLRAQWSDKIKPGA